MAGEGVYRSADGGESWTRVGLETSRHIGAILVHPRDANRVLVASLGHVFGSDPQRGVFLSRDGGRRWQPVLQTPDSVGAVDLAWDALEPDVVFAATWQMRLHPWLDYFMPQGGRGSGRVAEATMAANTGAGSRAGCPRAAWAASASPWPAAAAGASSMPACRRIRPRRQAPRVVVQGAGPGTPGAGPGTPGAAGAEAPKSGLYRSDDGGESWRLVNGDGSLGSSYFGRVIVSPDDTELVYVMGRSIRVSRDGGRHFEVLRGSPGGDDYHALWIDPRSRSA
jgi:photosystem II stability/assembly factor-like uncharacterized protein